MSDSAGLRQPSFIGPERAHAELEALYRLAAVSVVADAMLSGHWFVTAAVVEQLRRLADEAAGWTRLAGQAA